MLSFPREADASRTLVVRQSSWSRTPSGCIAQQSTRGDTTGLVCLYTWSPESLALQPGLFLCSPTLDKPPSSMVPQGGQTCVPVLARSNVQLEIASDLGLFAGWARLIRMVSRASRKSPRNEDKPDLPLGLGGGPVVQSSRRWRGYPLSASEIGASPSLGSVASTRVGAKPDASDDTRAHGVLESYRPTEPMTDSLGYREPKTASVRCGWASVSSIEHLSQDFR